MQTLATILVMCLIWISAFAYSKYRNDNFNPYK